MKQPVLAALLALGLSACAQATPPGQKAEKAESDPKPAGDAAPAAAAKAPSADNALPVMATAPTVVPKDDAEARVLKALRSVDPTIQIDRLSSAPLPGFREAIVGGSVLYVSDDGKYLLQGSLFDIEQKRDLSQIGLSVLRRAELAKIPQKDKIVFAPAKPKHTIFVFTDIECGYCRKLHQDIAEYNRLGIAIEYLAFPRAGTASQDFKNMESVWCSANRQKALTDAKNGLPIVPKTCTNPVNMQYQIGRKVGLQGTPMLVNREGIALPGYMAPAQLLQALDRLDAQSKETKSKSASVPAPTDGATAAGGL